MDLSVLWRGDTKERGVIILSLFSHERREQAMYRESRNRAGLSMEEASFRLHIGRKTLSNYENGYSQVPCEIVLQMAMIYNDPDLLVKHYTKTCPLGQIITQEYRKRDMATSVLGFLKELEDVNRRKYRLMEIASDGILDDSERPDFLSILKEVRELKQSIDDIEQYTRRQLGLEMNIEKEIATAGAIAK